MEKVRNTADKVFAFIEKYRLYIIPLFLIIVVSPLVMKYNGYELKSLENAPTVGVAVFEESYETKATMIFAKYVWFFMAFVSLLYTVFNYKKLKFRKIYIPVIVYTIMVSLSAVFSDYKDVVTQGYRLHMTIFMLLGLFVSFWYCACFLRDKTDVKFITCFAIILIVLENALGWFERKYGEIALFPFMKRIILGKKLYNSGFNYTYTLLGGEMSFDNIDYAGHFLSFAIPFLIAYAFFTDKLWKSIISLVLAVSSGAFVFIGGTTTGIFVCVCMVPIVVILGANKFVKKYYLTIPVIVLGVVAIIVSFNYWDKQLEAGEIEEHPFFRYFNIESFGISEEREKHPLEVKLEEKGFHFNTEGDDLILDFNGRRAIISYGLVGESFVLSAKAVNGNEYGLSMNGEDIFIEDPDFNGIRLRWKIVENFPMIELTCYDIGSYLFCLTDKGMCMYSDSGIVVQVVDDNSLFDPSYYNAASNRGYIWSFMIPSIKDRWLLGAGPNCAFAANQANSFRGLLYHSGSTAINTHNMYLQMAVETGVPSLIAFVVLVAWFVIKNWRTYCYRKDVRNGAFAFSVMAGMIGYCVGGLANDMIATSFPYVMTLFAAAVIITCKDQDEIEALKLQEESNKEVI
ncbi:MAG: O-antigen ligase family protein [Lachnospiraceae bacterium]|nr:O-antigen ligase family protein [Lachnospiraceae bacterium]